MTSIKNFKRENDKRMLRIFHNVSTRTVFRIENDYVDADSLVLLCNIHNLLTVLQLSLYTIPFIISPILVTSSNHRTCLCVSEYSFIPSFYCDLLSYY